MMHENAVGGWRIVPMNAHVDSHATARALQHRSGTMLHIQTNEIPLRPQLQVWASLCS